MLRCAILLVTVASLNAQIQLFYRGAVNAASSMPPGAPAGAIAQGSVFSLYGKSIGPASTPTLAFPLRTTLGGVALTVTQGATVVNAIPIFVSPGQVNAIMPSNAPTGAASLRLSVNGARSNPIPITVAAASFGIFTAAGTGQGPGIIQNYVSADSQPINALNAPAQPGQTEILWGTGLGPAPFADNAAPAAQNLATPVELFVGGAKASIAYSGRTPCCSGIDQIVFQVPNNAPLGCWVPVAVRTAGTTVSNYVTMAIGNNAGACSEPSNTMASALISGGNAASFVSARFSVRHDIAVVAAVEAITDYAAAYFAQEKAGPFNFNPNISLPPAGACTVYTGSGYVLGQSLLILPGMLPTGRGLNPGTLSISGAGSTASLKAPAGGFAQVTLGASVPAVPQLIGKLFLSPGSYNFAGIGGSDGPAFNVAVTVPSALAWTNRDQLAAVNRSQGLTVSWTGAAANNSVFLTGGAVDLPANVVTTFFCSASPGAASITVPAQVLAAMPATHTQLLQSLGAIYLGEWPIAAPSVFNGGGAAGGGAMHVHVLGKSVTFQ